MDASGGTARRGERGRGGAWTDEVARGEQGGSKGGESDCARTHQVGARGSRGNQRGVAASERGMSQYTS